MRRVKVIPVTSQEILRILGSLNIDEVEHILEEIEILRKNVKSSIYSQSYKIRAPNIFRILPSK
jgi:hypothetical protein